MHIIDQVRYNKKYINNLYYLINSIILSKGTILPISPNIQYQYSISIFNINIQYQYSISIFNINIKKSVNKKIQRILNALNKWQHAYNQGNPIVSDGVFDYYRKIYDQYADNNNINLFSTLENYELNFDAALSKRKIPMLSLSNIFHEEQLDNFLSKYSNINMSVEPKFDGVACELIYYDGTLVESFTRGNGYVGDCILEKILQIDSVPQSIANNNHEIINNETIIRGELCISRDNFSKIQHDEQFKTSRNLVTGCLANKSFNALKERSVEFIAYSMHILNAHSPNVNNTLCTQKQSLEYMKKIGFNISSPFIISKSKDDILDYYYALLNANHRLYLDGIVIRINEFNICDAIGSTASSPRWATAFKFPNRTEITKICSINFSVSRNGKITPVANIEPCVIDNVLIQNVTLHNVNYMNQIRAGIGSEIEICRSGDVIPYITNVITPSDRLITLNQCPSCQHKLLTFKSNLYCTNRYSCEQQNIRKIEHFFSLNAIYIKGLSYARITQLYQANICTKIVDILNIENFVQEIIALDGWGKKSFENLSQSIQYARKNIDLDKLIFAFGIKHIGNILAGRISQFASIYDAFLSQEIALISQAIQDALSQINGVGDIAINEVDEFFNIYADQISEIISNIYINKPVYEDLHYNKNILFTGTMPEKRNNLKLIAKNKGLNPASSISKSLHYLVVGDNPSDSKIKFANANNIKIISYASFLDLDIE